MVLPENIHTSGSIRTIFIYIFIYIYVCNEKEAEFEREQGWIYGRACREESRGVM